MEENNNALDIFGGDDAMKQAIMAHANELLDTMLDFKELMFYYSSAIREIRTKLEILNTEFELKYQRNPISSIQTRLKSRLSIMEKMPVASRESPLSFGSILIFLGIENSSRFCWIISNHAIKKAPHF